MTDATQQGDVFFSVSEKIATIEFYHPLSNSLPGKVLNKLADTITEAGANAEVNIMALAYVERLISLTGLTLATPTWKPITLSCYMLASKVWDDESMVNIEISYYEMKDL